MSRTSLPQPDSALRILPEYGGNTRDETSYVVGIPELVIEICQSSAAYDFGPKLRVYETAAVPEYITMSLSDSQIVWGELLEARYQPLAPDSGGVIHSRVFPGLWLNTEGALAGDVHQVLEDLRRGLESQEHADFVRKLANRKR